VAFDVGDRRLDVFQALVSADSRHLDLIVSDRSAVEPNQLAARYRFVVFRFHLPDGQAEAPAQNVGVATGGFPALWRPTTDGRSLYTVGQSNRTVWAQFLDAPGGAVERLQLPFAPAAGWPRNTRGTSADGRYLYALSPSTGQLAIVDLAERRIAQVIDIQMPGSVADGNAPSNVEIRVSADGRRMYATGSASGGRDQMPAGVLAIDMGDWHVIGDWLPNVPVAQLLLTRDGKRLLIQEPPFTRESGAGVIHVLDTGTGVELLSSQPLPLVPLRSVDELYRTAYGHGPAEPVPPSAAPVVGVASMVLTAEPHTGVAGDLVQLETRFVDPRTAGVMRPDQTDVGFSPPAEVTVRLVGGGNESAPPSTLHQSAFGVFRGSMLLPATSSSSLGTWTVLAEAVWADGTTRPVDANDGISVRPTFTGTDGRAYVMQTDVEPPQPPLDQDVQVTVAIVDAHTLAPLPEDVDLSGGLPQQLEIAGYSSGVTSRSFAQTRHGVYAGTLNLWSSGDWQLWAAAPDGEGQTGRFLIGALHVVTPATN
jgi:hypothetical protein